MITLRFRTIWMVLAAASMLSLSACSQSDSDKSPSAASDEGDAQSGGSPSAAPAGALTIPEDADPDTKNYFLTENAIAACMKKRGFTYTPNPGFTENEASSSIDGADYALAKKYRQKYGFGIYARAVYPNDPAAPGPAENKNPNASYRASMPSAQQKEYDKALGAPGPLHDNDRYEGPPKGSCSAEAHLKVYGPAKSAAEQEQENAKQAERDRQAGQALNGDPQLVSLAQEYASCLRKAGITVGTTQPTSIGDTVKFQVSAEIPPDAQSPSKEEAMPKLTREIDLALKDLECGKNFRAAYWPKYKKNPYVGNNG
ncbi:hypothetical protein [Streptomyces sp. GESEQ-4]|uniref:hypothetical protein n=1 Tax=Streptomyces sp. GESEQ-4 TaxID=2812655 RepID=UPI001B331130|nr:hypothetical protein [Streptomyces sp. GESEQ-4]